MLVRQAIIPFLVGQDRPHVERVPGQRQVRRRLGNPRQCVHAHTRLAAFNQVGLQGRNYLCETQRNEVGADRLCKITRTQGIRGSHGYSPGRLRRQQRFFPVNIKPAYLRPLDQGQPFFREQFCVGAGQVMIHDERRFLAGIKQVRRQQHVQFRDQGCDTL